MDKPKQKHSRLERFRNFLVPKLKSRGQLLELLRDAKNRNLLDAHALGMIEGVLHVSELQVRDVMIPRAQLVVIEYDAKLDEFLPMMVESAHSRFPVIGENRDEVIGILLAKDMLTHFLDEGSETFEITKYLRPAVFIPESKRLDTLLQEFRIKRNHMAIVMDEYGGVAGLITIEDVLEQIVGEIEDEYDIEDVINIRKNSNTQFIVRALTPISEFNEFFETNFSDEEFDTIGGYVTHEIGHLPSRKETVTLNHLRFRILQTDERRIRLLQVTTLKKK